MKALVFDRIGLPLDVLRVEDVPLPRVGDEDVLIRVTAASINPGDYLFIQNLYPEPKKPKFPRQIAGIYGAGVVERRGRNVAMKEGQHVAFGYYNAWAEYVAVPAAWAIPLPADYPAAKAAQLFNLITASDLLALAARPGGWLGLTAGHSTVSLFLLQLAARRGVHSVPIVRREVPGLDLRALGAASVLSLNATAEIGAEIQRVTGGHGFDGVVDGVGGPTTKPLIENLALRGTLVIHGGFSAETYPVHNFDFLMRLATLRTYLYRYFFEPPPPSDTPMLETLIAETAGEDFVAPVAAEHPLEAFREAIEGSVQSPERGKRLFRLHKS